MASLCLRGSIRIHCLNMGTSKWKEGSCEVVEKDNKYSLVVTFNAGGVPAKFQLHQNIKNVVLRPAGVKQSRLLVTLKDTSSLTIDKVASKDAEELKHFLEALSHDKTPTVKPVQGSGSFGGILGNRSAQRDSNRPLTNLQSQTPTKRVSFDTKDETPVKKQLTNNGRTLNGMTPNRSGNSPVTSTPHRTSLTETRSEKRKRIQSPGSDIEDYPKENDSSTTNKALTDPGRKFLNSSREKQLNLKQTEENRPGLMPLQSSSFYSSRLSSKDYSTGNSDRTSGCGQPSAKRSLVLPSQPSPLSVKKLRPNQDYTGWNKPRVLSNHPQPQQLQGFSNLGNTCYMNAILQSLFSLQPFANDLLKQGIPYKRIPMNALIRRFAFLLAKKDVCSAEMKKDLLKKVKSAISATAERFSGYMQNDAHEFLSQCLDQLKEDMGKLNKTWKSELSSGDDASAVKATEDVAATRVYTCPVINNFEFEAQHSISCKMCGEIVIKREQFNDLSIDLPRRKKLLASRSIQDSLDLFFRMEDLEYSCEKCNGKSATVIHKFSRLPKVLILHLKRYSFNVTLSLNNKVGQQVIIPRYLTLLSHCTECTRPPLSLSCNIQTVTSSRPLKASQMVNSCTANSVVLRKQPLKSASNTPVCLDSESDDEHLKRCVASTQRLSTIFQGKEQQTEDQKPKAQSPKCPEVADTSFDDMNDEDLMAAVIEISKKDSPMGQEEEKLASSPDTGFGGDDDLQETTATMEVSEEQKSNVAKDSGVTQYSDLVKDFDENKENKTPEGAQNEVEWVQYELEREREEQELQQALAQSLQEQEARELMEDDDLKRATELSLQEFNSSMLDGIMSDEDSGNEDVFDMEYTEEETEELKRNAETGELPHSYRLVSVVSHIGSSSSSGHYISDVCDVKKQAWFTYNDLAVSRTQEITVQSDRDRSGYIFFYMHKDIFDEGVEEEKKAQVTTAEANRSSRPL
ncbi:PREDICTED: ubiquitin carboxyl-terminal hydrolase 37 [Nanorana parkeri]|uniref:ubiquitin carboxyl-terminal hydrolase 37 n=1 Tax=Nanorana parkeri TaxID=125878 RepID=UPI000854B534|nr:PREDICTED: ubiquitin carboxyl-terminal hydrolase 37 [Nanorana parkeri]